MQRERVRVPQSVGKHAASQPLVSATSQILHSSSSSSSSSSVYCAGQRSTPHYRTLEVRPGRITKKSELKYDYDCERDDTNSLLGVLMFGWDVVIANNE